MELGVRIKIAAPALAKPARPNDQAEAFRRVKIREIRIVASHQDRAGALSRISRSARIVGNWERPRR
jgi:hypothetical protein